MCKRGSGNQSARIDANCTWYNYSMSGIPQGGTTNQSYWKLMCGLWVVLIHEPQNEPEWFKKPARKMQMLRHNLRTGCIISSLLRVLFFFSMSEPLAPPMLLPAFVLGYTYGIHQWSVDPSTRFFLAMSLPPRHIHGTKAKSAPSSLLAAPSRTRHAPPFSTTACWARADFRCDLGSSGHAACHARAVVSATSRVRAARRWQQQRLGGGGLLVASDGKIQQNVGITIKPSKMEV